MKEKKLDERNSRLFVRKQEIVSHKNNGSCNIEYRFRNILTLVSFGIRA